MVKMFKLVSQDLTTHGGMKWAIGKTNRAIKAGKEMCTNQVLHCYSDPNLAVLFNPIHANISNPILFEIECSTIVASDGLKHACKAQTPIRQLELPVFTTNQRVAFAIKCALLVFEDSAFVSWANAWLDGTNRSDAAARVAARAADAAEAAARAAARAAPDFAAIAQWVLKEFKE